MVKNCDEDGDDDEGRGGEEAKVPKWRGAKSKESAVTHQQQGKEGEKGGMLEWTTVDGTVLNGNGGELKVLARSLLIPHPSPYSDFPGYFPTPCDRIKFRSASHTLCHIFASNGGYIRRHLFISLSL